MDNAWKQKLDSLFITFGPFAFSSLVKISNTQQIRFKDHKKKFCIFQRSIRNHKQFSLSHHWFKHSYGTYKSSAFHEDQYSLNQIIIKQMHKFLKPKLFCPGVSIKIANKHICQLIKYRHKNILIYKPC